MSKRKKEPEVLLYSCVVDKEQSAVVQVLAMFLGWSWNSQAIYNIPSEIYQPTKSDGSVINRFRLYFHMKKKMITWGFANTQEQKEEVRIKFAEAVELFSKKIINKKGE